MQSLSGIGALLKGFRMLTHRQLRAFVVLPVLLNIILYTAIIYLAAIQFNHFNAWLTNWLPSWLAWLHWLLWPLFVLAAAIVVVYTFTFLGNIVGAPFNELLASKVMALQGCTSDIEEDGVVSFIKEIPYAIGMQLRLLWYYLPRALGLLIVFVIPGLQIIAPFIWLAFNAWVLAMQYLDYPIEIKKQSFSQLQEFMHTNRGPSFSFGMGVLGASLIPGINLISMPAAVIGAALINVSRDKQ